MAGAREYWSTAKKPEFWVWLVKNADTAVLLDKKIIRMTINGVYFDLEVVGVGNVKDLPKP